MVEVLETMKEVPDELLSIFSSKHCRMSIMYRENLYTIASKI